MSPNEAKYNHGAEYYTTTSNGVSPQMYYKRETLQFNDGTRSVVWVYLSFANLWMGSHYIRTHPNGNVPIEFVRIL